MSSGGRPKDGTYFLQPKIFKYRADKLISSTDYVVYSFLCSCRNNKSNQCFPSHEFIAQQTGVSRSTVSASIERLVKLKLIKIVLRFDYRKGKSNTYEIIFDHVHDQKSQKQKYPSPDEMAEISIQTLHELIKEKMVDNQVK